jgi:DNA-binding transcriptional ArsR family regulator
MSVDPLTASAGPETQVVAKFFRGLGDPTRVRILTLLAERERTVGELVTALGSLQGRVSSHLACLRWCGMVASRREGRSAYYRLADQRIRQILDLALGFVDDQDQQIELCRIIDQDASHVPAPVSSP